MTDAAQERQRGPETVSVFGSCVTRDNFNSHFNPGYKEYFEVKLSANQTSVIALMSPPIEDEFAPLRKMSDYDRWNVGSDLTREFLPKLAELRPDYLILDLLLPDEGGEVILRRVRDAGLKTRVAVTTGTDNAEQLREVKALKPEALFEKPVNVADVWRKAR